MQVDHFDILVRSTQQSSKQKMCFWAQGCIFQEDVNFGGMTITLWGTVGGAVRHQIWGRMSPYRRRAARRKKVKQDYFVPDNPTMEQVVAQLEKHMIWLTLST